MAYTHTHTQTMRQRVQIKAMVIYRASLEITHITWIMNWSHFFNFSSFASFILSISPIRILVLFDKWNGATQLHLSIN